MLKWECWGRWTLAAASCCARVLLLPAGTFTMSYASLTQPPVNFHPAPAALLQMKSSRRRRVAGAWCWKVSHRCRACWGRWWTMEKMMRMGTHCPCEVGAC